MTEVHEVQRLTDAVLTMIAEDQGRGQIPPDVSSLDELDNYVDIDDYYRRIRMPASGHDAAQLRRAVDEEVGRRLAAAQGGPWHVIWRRPDGGTEDIGKSVGYPNQEEAQAVGRGHLHSHGGGFHLLRT